MDCLVAMVTSFFSHSHHWYSNILLGIFICCKVFLLCFFLFFLNHHSIFTIAFYSTIPLIQSSSRKTLLRQTDRAICELINLLSYQITLWIFDGNGFMLDVRLLFISTENRLSLSSVCSMSIQGRYAAGLWNMFAFERMCRYLCRPCNYSTQNAIQISNKNKFFFISSFHLLTYFK